MSDDPKLSQRYRELPREEPPRALDDAILAASRRAVHKRRRWYVPVAAAAVIVLAVAVVAHIDREQPDSELLTPPATVLETPPPPAPPVAAERRRDEAPRAATKPAQPRSAREAPAREADNRMEGARVQSVPAAAPMLAQVARSPEQWLQGIADLRRQGRHEEADRELAEFRKRYPDYRLSDEMRAKVERR